MSDFHLFLVWIISALVGGVIIYFRQGKFLADVQLLSFLMCGPLTLLVALLVPKSLLTSKELSEGK